VKFLRDDGIRIDGVGLQSHFTTGRSPSLDQQIATMEGFTDLGLEVAITELDVRNPQPENATVLEGQSKAYGDAVGACMQVDRCVGVTVWDFYDPVSFPRAFERIRFSNLNSIPGCHPSSQGQATQIYGFQTSRNTRLIMES